MIRDEYREVLRPFIQNHRNCDDGCFTKQEEQQNLNKAVNKLLAINKRRMPGKKTDPNNLAGDPGRWETTIAGFNNAVDLAEKELTQ